MSRTLLHICCAPCSVSCIRVLRNEGIEPVGYWYNPNIHPYTEYRSRKTTLESYAASIQMKLIINNEYGLRPFIRAIYPSFNDRCAVCYRIRLEQTAAYAAQNGFESFSTTLLISPYQKHDLLRQIGSEVAAAHGISFLYHDFRPFFREGQNFARQNGFYMQKYCGCIFSEEERYRKKHLIPD